MNTEQIELRMETFQDRVTALQKTGTSFVSILYWPGMWTISAPMVDIRARSEAIEDALEDFDKALTALENRDRHLSQTIGAPIPEHT